MRAAGQGRPVRAAYGPQARPRGAAGSRTADAVRSGPLVRSGPPIGHCGDMCRSIRVLHNFEPPATDEEIEAAALQYVRKISGSARPSAANQEAFDEAVRAVAAATRTLLESLVTAAPPRDREVEAAKARARAAERYGRPATMAGA